MSGLRELLDAATPGPWIFDPELADDDHGALHNVWHTSERGLRAVTHDIFDPSNARLIALVPELAQLCLDMGEELAAWHALNRYRSDTTAVLLARLDRIGKEEA